VRQDIGPAVMVVLRSHTNRYAKARNGAESRPCWMAKTVGIYAISPIGMRFGAWLPVQLGSSW